MFSDLVEASIVGMSRSIYLSSPCVACLIKVHAKKICAATRRRILA